MKANLSKILFFGGCLSEMNLPDLSINLKIYSLEVLLSNVFQGKTKLKENIFKDNKISLTISK